MINQDKANVLVQMFQELDYVFSFFEPEADDEYWGSGPPPGPQTLDDMTGDKPSTSLFDLQDDGLLEIYRGRNGKYYAVLTDLGKEMRKVFRDERAKCNQYATHQPAKAQSPPARSTV